MLGKSIIIADAWDRVISGVMSYVILMSTAVQQMVLRLPSNRQRLNKDSCEDCE